MMKPATVIVFLLAAAAAGMPLGSVQARPAAPDTEVSIIIARAVERAAWAQTQDFGAGFRGTMTQHSQRFDNQGEATDDEIRGYVIEPHQGVPYAKQVTKDGEPIAGDDDLSVVFDRDLLDRYTAKLVGIRALRGRPAYLLDFEPRPGKLPVRRRVDHALNKSRGQIWIDEETYEIAQIHFELMERVRFWWGILGSVSEASGHFERIPIADGAWLASEVDVYFHVRALFSTSRRREITVWSAFEPVVE